MSWQAYVDTNLVGTGKVAKAAIFGLDGSLWATSSDFAISGAEAKKLVGAFTDPSDIAANGLFLEGTKFVYLRTQGDSIYARNGATGITATKTGQCVLVGYYNENQQGGDCNTTVEGLATYLVGVGY
ncbi:profilin, required for normal timing of actin polymerization in response to thermal stress [Mortierella sp. GBA35]|nr:profilin, required for normal timing of actin polymerization in response to thermal stress [Mortierella sp. GBA35]KAF9097403.1 profilin, required for normal timing of actin polymerization in response to thermal stress [Mortierella sp. AD031]KAG0212966.1 profilin, required for normal timing of actin polymerization in response to thermal stress [Mortierella sp. NVP41]